MNGDDNVHSNQGEEQAIPVQEVKDLEKRRQCQPYSVAYNREAYHRPSELSLSSDIIPVERERCEPFPARSPVRIVHKNLRRWTDI